MDLSEQLLLMPHTMRLWCARRIEILRYINHDIDLLRIEDLLNYNGEMYTCIPSVDEETGEDIGMNQYNVLISDDIKSGILERIDNNYDNFGFITSFVHENNNVKIYPAELDDGFLFYLDDYVAISLVSKKPFSIDDQNKVFNFYNGTYRNNS